MARGVEHQWSTSAFGQECPGERPGGLWVRTNSAVSWNVSCRIIRIVKRILFSIKYQHNSKSGQNDWLPTIRPRTQGNMQRTSSQFRGNHSAAIWWILRMKIGWRWRKRKAALLFLHRLLFKWWISWKLPATEWVDIPYFSFNNHFQNIHEALLEPIKAARVEEDADCMICGLVIFWGKYAPV